MELGIYIHIPFCIRKCDYCDFISFPNKFELQEEYTEKLIEEIEDNKELIKQNEITTIYIGGGTPSSIKPELIEKVLLKIYEIGKLSITDKKEVKNKNGQIVEITIEINPGTISEKIKKEENAQIIEKQEEKLKLYRSYGINRLSIGLQSTNDKILKNIGRIHGFEQFLNTYKSAIEAGFNNINLDLMLGLPGQSITDLKESLEIVTNLKPEPKHISVYSLIVEDGTEIERKIISKELELPSEEEERNQYKYTKNFLELNRI